MPAVLMSRELEIIGMRLNNYRFPEVIKWSIDKKVDPAAIVTHTFPVWEAGRAFQYNDARPEAVLKTILTF